MNRAFLIPAFLLAATLTATAQDAPTADAPPAESMHEYHASLSITDDATVYSGLQVPLPKLLNQVLVEPTFTFLDKPRFSFSTSLAGVADKYTDTFTQLRVKETYAGLSTGDFDWMVGRRIVRWGTGYAFTAAGVLDPPRLPPNPTDRLNLNEGRDMVKADYVHGSQAITAAWSSAALAPASANLRDTTAVRYNVLAHGFDTSLIAGHDRGGDSFGALDFTRVLGEAWEVHGEAAWREQGAVLVGAKCTLHSGVTFIGEFYTPPNTAYFRDMSVSPLAGRPHYAFFNVGKSRLRELPGWKEWDVSGSVVANLDGHSFTSVVDVNRWYGKHVSSYLHMEVPT